MADKVMWKRRGYFIAEEGTHTIVADCRYTQYNDVDKHEGMIQEIIDSHNKGIEAMKLLESLTPEGSEFHNDPERCVEWVRERLSGVVEQVKKRKAAEAEIRQLHKKCLAIVGKYVDTEEDGWVLGEIYDDIDDLVLTPS